MREVSRLSEGEWVRNPQDKAGSLLGGGDPGQREDNEDGGQSSQITCCHKAGTDAAPEFFLLLLTISFSCSDRKA